MAKLAQLRDGYGNMYSLGALTDEIASKKHNYPWKTSAHRGYTASGMPQNTIPALIEAAKQGFNWCECDVRSTSDGVFVLSHDATVTGTVGGEAVTYTVANETYETLSRLLLAKSDTYGDIFISTWAEFCNTANILQMEIHADRKVNDTNTTAEFVEIAMRNGMGGKVIYHQDPVNVFATDPRAGTAVVIGANYETSFETYKKYLNGANRVFATAQVSSEYCAEEIFLAARKCGFLTHIWGVSATASTYTKAFDLRPDVIEPLSASQGTDISALYINSFGL